MKSQVCYKNIQVGFTFFSSNTSHVNYKLRLHYIVGCFLRDSAYGHFKKRANHIKPLQKKVTHIYITQNSICARLTNQCVPGVSVYFARNILIGQSSICTMNLSWDFFLFLSRNI